MAFKVRNHRNEDGTYSLEYGKGAKKRTGMMHQGTEGWEATNVPGSFPKMRDAKEAWGHWAESAYGGAIPTTPPPGAVGPASAPPAPERVPGPPALPKGPPALSRSKGPPSLPPKPGNDDPALEQGEADFEQHEADPFSTLMRHPSDHPDPAKKQALTPLGVLVELDGWGRRYFRRIQQVNAKLALTEAPGYDPFDGMLRAVRECLAREIPTKEAP